MDLDKVDLMTQIDSMKRGWLACEAERDALAALVTELRGALEEVKCYMDLYRDEVPLQADDLHQIEEDQALADTALALPLQAAAERVKDWREKAERLDDWATKWEDYVKAPSWGDSKERESFVEADTNLRRYARELRAARGGK
jgi:hypothetical protein